MKTRWALLACVLATSCRRPIVVDTSSSALIPRDLAIERLKEVLATADAAECTQPRNRLGREEVREWAVDDQGVEARAPMRTSVGFAYKDVTATRLDKVNLFYQVRVFTPRQPNPKKDYVHFNFQDEAAARRALELLDALRNKKE